MAQVPYVGFVSGTGKLCDVPAAARIKDSDEARKLLEWRPGVAAVTGLPHGEERQRYMMMRSKVMAEWMTKDDGSSASEDIEGL